MSPPIPVSVLSSGDKPIPLLGFGTAEYPFGSSSDMRDTILHAIKLGYRHFDSAALYRTEQPLKVAIADAVLLGYIESREELFITSKLWCSDAHKGLIVPALKRSLENLGLDYLDLYLVHFPVSVKPGEYELPVKKEDLVEFDMNGVWEGMEECKRLGLVKYIGVSNFSCKKLERLLSVAKVVPHVNQVEMNPLWQQKNLREFCKTKGILITAYSPLGARGTLWGTSRVMDCQVLKDIAQEKGKTLAQVCLRWAYEQGVSVVVKSFNKDRMEENLDIFNWELSPEESHRIGEIPQVKGFPGIEFVSEGGPYKTVHDLWDGEI
ncbi:hypothetical protein MLD38_017576 [Melastoma candidum]|uniref:Uncharacterized protein n=1 Tax=Melastoma candidum TaxID=119954 RepID=A0ACB9QR84_9MYRT|nr:hypothetical protein MLD38_017576 [Melastoma candidum]